MSDSDPANYVHNLGDEATGRCTNAGPQGRFCDRPIAPGSPVSLCTRHLSQAFDYARSLIRAESHRRRLDSLGESLDDQRAQALAASKRPGTVYYLRVGDLIKIGYTTDLQQRLTSYPPNTILLAHEPGDPQLEAERHKQFARHRASGREWFHPNPQIDEHIGPIAAAIAAETYRYRQLIGGRQSDKWERFAGARRCRNDVQLTGIRAGLIRVERDCLNAERTGLAVLSAVVLIATGIAYTVHSGLIP